MDVDGIVKPVSLGGFPFLDFRQRLDSKRSRRRSKSNFGCGSATSGSRTTFSLKGKPTCPIPIALAYPVSVAPK
jgi:hypothetical protein